MTETTEIRRLPIGKPTDEIASKAISLAVACKKLQAATDAKKDAANQFNRDIKRLEGVVEELSAEVVDGVRIGDVECTADVVAVAGDFEFVVTRTDTGETVETREATDEEVNAFKQTTLTLEDRGARNGRRLPKGADGDDGEATKLPDDDDEDPDYGADGYDDSNVAHLPSVG